MGYYSLIKACKFEEPFSDSETLEHEKDFREKKSRLEALVMQDPALVESMQEWMASNRERYAGELYFFNYYLSEGGYEHLKKNVENSGSTQLQDAFRAYSNKRDLFMRKYYRLVFSYVNHFSQSFHKKKREEIFDDLFQEGYLGLVKALEYHNPADSKFKTFAVWCIRSSILDYLRKIKKTKTIGLEEDYWGDSSKSKRNGRPIPDEKNSCVLHELMETDENHYLDNLLNKVLSRDQRDLIERYLGLFGREAVDPKKIAEKLNITYTAVRVRKKHALDKLRKHVQAQFIAHTV